MALTMTRTRNQTTLTKLATLTATVHGELAYVDGRLTGDLRPEVRVGWLDGAVSCLGCGRHCT
ncbi:MAG: hypothetical protein MZW92_36200 [Comamonadaceae bacterium]|nr:hypothetical protein [Comamonadaceae bacterium]